MLTYLLTATHCGCAIKFVCENAKAERTETRWSMPCPLCGVVVSYDVEKQEE